MALSVRRLTAWRRSFDLAVEVFRLTGRMEDARTNGLASRMRQTALRVPVLITRSASQASRLACHADLTRAIGVLGDLEWQLRISRVLVHLEPQEEHLVSKQLDASRSSLRALAARTAPTGPEER